MRWIGFSATESLQEGENIISAQAMDKVGNSVTVEMVIARTNATKRGDKPDDKPGSGGDDDTDHGLPTEPGNKGLFAGYLPYMMIGLIVGLSCVGAAEAYRMKKRSSGGQTNNGLSRKMSR